MVSVEGGGNDLEDIYPSVFRLPQGFAGIFHLHKPDLVCLCHKVCHFEKQSEVEFNPQHFAMPTGKRLVVPQDAGVVEQVKRLGP